MKSDYDKERALLHFQQKNRGVERHTHQFITFYDDPIKIIYCAQCWDVEGEVIQVKMTENRFSCPLCHNYDDVPLEEYEEIIEFRKRNQNSY